MTLLRLAPDPAMIHRQRLISALAMALAALAAGADGLLVEVHPDPDHALSDGAQSLTFAAFEQLLESLKRVAEPLERAIT